MSISNSNTYNFIFKKIWVSSEKGSSIQFMWKQASFHSFQGKAEDYLKRIYCLQKKVSYHFPILFSTYNTSVMTASGSFNPQELPGRVD